MWTKNFKRKFILEKLCVNNSYFYWKFLLYYILSLFIVIKLFNIYLNVLFEVNITYLIIYLTIIWITSMIMTVIILEKFLQHNKFVECNLFGGANKQTSKATLTESINFDEISKTTDSQFISIWFNKISDDKKFPIKSRQIIQEVSQKLLQVYLHVNTTYVTYLTGNILLRHIKEFRRSIIRAQKYGGNIPELYRYSHTCTNSEMTQKYFIHQLTTSLLANFINWELWNSLPCHVLVSVISKKLADLVLSLLSKPEFLNYYILFACASEEVCQDLKLNEYAFIKLKDNKTTSVGETQYKLNEETENRRDEKRVEEETDAATSQQTNPEEVSLRSPLYDSQVKIYEPKSVSKTWTTNNDLASLSVGEDPLHMLNDRPDSENTNFKNGLWAETPDRHFSVSQNDFDIVGTTLEDEGSLSNSAKSLLDEVKNINLSSMEGFRSSMKPLSNVTVNTLHNIKDFQENTVSNVVKPVSLVTSTALHKIGDLQDEAAGVVEGLLDFGIAGFKKGLKLTGLQESATEGITVSDKRKKLKKISEAEAADTESVWINPLQRDASIENVEIMIKNKAGRELEKETGGSLESPQITLSSISTVTETDSPDPEYEETADLATTIAKLRSLLQQKSSESNISTPAVSPMPTEEMTMRTAENADEVDGVVPSFYKFCAKTATGVFNNTLNTIKTALPVNPSDSISPNSHKWVYIERSENEDDLVNQMNKLLFERKAYCTVEPAYEAFDSLQLDKTEHISQIQFQDELDDYELKIPITKTIVDVCCELLADSNSIIIEEPMVKLILLIFGKSIESKLSAKIDEFSKRLGDLSALSLSSSDKVLSMDSKVFVSHLMSSIPEFLLVLLGYETVEGAVTLLLSSLQDLKINQDVIMQIFEVVCIKFIEESNHLTPPHSA